MSNLTFRQWLSRIPRGRERSEEYVSLGMWQILGGIFMIVFPLIIAMTVVSSLWFIWPIISGFFLILRGLWNCDGEDEREKAND